MYSNRAESGLQDIEPELSLIEYIAIADYETTEQDCLSFQENQIIEIVEKPDGGWWWANLNGKVGWVPSTYLEKNKVQKYENQKGPALLVKKSSLLNFKPKKCHAVENFSSGQSRDTISFNKGEIFDLIEKSPTGWWYVKNIRGKEGWGPDEYLRDGEGVKITRPTPVAPKKRSVNSNNVETKTNNIKLANTQFSKSIEISSLNKVNERTTPPVPVVANTLQGSGTIKGPDIPSRPRPSQKATQPVLPDRPGRKVEPPAPKGGYSEKRPITHPGPPLPGRQPSIFQPVARSSLQTDFNNDNLSPPLLKTSKSIPEQLSENLNNTISKYDFQIKNSQERNSSIINQTKARVNNSNHQKLATMHKSQEDISINRTSNLTINSKHSLEVNSSATNFKTNNVNNQLADILAKRNQASEINNLTPQRNVPSTTNSTSLKPNLTDKPKITLPNNALKPTLTTKPVVNSGNKPILSQKPVTPQQIVPNKPRIVKPAIIAKPQLETSSKPINTNQNLYVATCDFTAQSADCVSLIQGDLVEVLDPENEDWWWIKVNGKEGWGPGAILKKKGDVNYSSVTIKQADPISNKKVTRKAYKTEYDGSLSFQEGEVVEILEEDTNKIGWTWAKIRNEEGWVPTSLIRNAN